MIVIRTALALLTLAGAALAQEGRLTLLDGKVHDNATLVSLSDSDVVFTTEKGRSVRIDAEQVVTYARFDDAEPALDPETSDVAVLLRGGDIVLGTLVEGPEERVRVTSPLIGELSFPVDSVAEIRFLAAWSKTIEKPTYEAEERALDTVVYRSLDKLSCTFLESGGTSIFVHGRIGERHPISHESLLAVRFADFEAPTVPEGRSFVMLLEDGSRITTVTARTEQETIVARTVRGDRVRFPLSQLVAFYQSGGRFVFLSDNEADEVEIVPWIGETYWWHRPRYDRSFLDSPLRSGGVIYRKGLGVISGTSLTFEVGEGYRLFTSLIALDDTAGSEGDVRFEVLRDGESVFQSKPVRMLERGEAPVRIPPIDIRGAKRITLRVTYVDDFVRDYANWLEPMLIR